MNQSWSWDSQIAVKKKTTKKQKNPDKKVITIPQSLSE